MAAKRAYGGLSADERDARRRERLIEAGLELYGSEGYPATSIEAICAQAGVSTRNFYDHFATREDLLIAVYDRITEDARRAIAAAIADPSLTLDERARAGIEAFVHVMLADERRARVNFIEVIGASRRVEAHRREVIRDFAATLEAVATELMDAGMLPTRPARTGSLALIGAVQEVLRDWVTGDDRPPLDPIVDDLVRLFVAAGFA